MQLLGGATTPAPEFASISLLLRNSSANDAIEPVSLGEPLLLASPLATVSAASASAALVELHNHLFHIVSTPEADTIQREDSVAIELLTLDHKEGQYTQIFRPSSARGVGLYYHLEQGNETIFTSVASLGLVSRQSGDSETKIDPAKIYGVLFCVGISGLCWAHGSPSVPYSIAQRMNDCVAVLETIGDKEVSSAKTVLSTLFLTETEYRKSNALVQAKNTIVVPDAVSLASSNMGGKKARKSKPSTSLASNAAELRLLVQLQPDSSDTSRTMMEQMTLLSVSEKEISLKQYNASGSERRANLDISAGSKSRFRRRKGDTKDADLDGFDFKGPKRETVAKRVASSPRMHDMPNEFANGLPTTPASGLQLKSSKKDTKTKGKAVVPVLSASQSDASHSKASRKPNRSAGDDGSAVVRTQSTGSAGASNRLQVNIALNEDLTCVYKQSQLSTASVEGVIQLQLKSNARAIVPFHLFLRDPSSHIATLQENRTFAEDATRELERDGATDFADRKFMVSVQKGDNYIPVLRYKCTPELRPVPIRVQTRVKVEGNVCRVALQISSNPNNSASLADLTIMMNVSEHLVGESLVTQPEGGVWDDAKRSVIWCVSELGSGEKFQLQARLQIAESNIAVEDLSFPVAVRCQCLFAQLSDLELEVRDIPEVAPAEMTMKIARRFRLSHREKS